MRACFDYGDKVRVTRNVRNDGTYPGMDVGAPLLRRGCVGYVVNIGTYLQDQIIYSVHFFDDDMVVGCREDELIPAAATWVPSRFEFRDKVVAKMAMSVNGAVVVALGDDGEILKVLRYASHDTDNATPTEVAYHVRFLGYTLRVPERALCTAESEEETGERSGAQAQFNDMPYCIPGYPDDTDEMGGLS